MENCELALNDLGGHVSGEKLFRTATGQRLHLRPCPHIHGADVVEDTVGSLDVCDWSQAELTGAGRTYYDVLDDALQAFGAPVEVIARIRQEVGTLAHDSIWIPNSRSYVAIGRGGPAVCWIGKTYVMHVGGEFIELPGYAPGGGGGQVVLQREGGVCPTCWTTMPVTGRCDVCA